jgi:hypothetical protein
VISPRGVTVVGTESRRSLYEMKEMRRLSLVGVRWEGIAGEGDGTCAGCTGAVPVA